jgi:hypothetical protein
MLVTTSLSGGLWPSTFVNECADCIKFKALVVMTGCKYRLW